MMKPVYVLLALCLFFPLSLSAQENVPEEIVGIGVEFKTDKALKYPIVMGVAEGSPAHEAHVQPGDIIQKIDWKTTEDRSTEEVAFAIRGKAGTAVVLHLLRGDAVEITSINRKPMMTDKLQWVPVDEKRIKAAESNPLNQPGK